MTKWEAQSDSDGSDLSAWMVLGNLLQTEGMVGLGGRELHRGQGKRQ